MRRFTVQVGRAGLMGLIWAAAWLLPSMMGGSILHGELEPQHIGGALAGLPGGFLFASFAGIASGRRRLGSLSLTRAAACGAASGALVGMLPFLIGSQYAPGDRPLWVLPVVLTIGLSGICAASALVSRWVGSRNEASQGA